MSVVVEHIDGYPRTEDVVVPLRRIVRRVEGRRDVSLRLECGHTVTRPRRRQHQRDARCEHCARESV
jgi:hypothetical protein